MQSLFPVIKRASPNLFIMGVRVAMMAAKFVLAIFIARFLGLEALGFYGLIASAASVVPVFFKAGMHNILAREAVTQPPEDMARNLFHYYAGVFGAYMFVLPMVVLAGWLAGHGVLSFMLAALVMIEHVVSDWYFLLVSRRRAVGANLMLFVQAGAWMLAFMGLAWLLPELRTMPALLSFWALGGVLALAFAAPYWRGLPWRSVIAQGLSRAWYIEHWKKSRFFYAGDIGNAGGIHIDRYLVGLILGLELTGVYVLFWQMANAVNTLVSTGVLQLYRPRLIESFKSDSRELFNALYRRSMRDIALSALGLGFAVAAIAPLVTAWTDSPLALSYLPLFWALLSGIVVRGLYDGAGNALLARYMDRALIGSNLFLLAAVSVFVFAGLHAVGIYGAALGLPLAYGVLLAYRQSVLNKS